jgi:hypothetical protein
VFLSTLLAAVSFSAVEGWSFGNALWFCFITVLTIGYGDIIPSTHLGRAIVFAYAFVGLSWLSMCVGAIHKHCTTTLFARTRVINSHTSRVDGVLLASPLALVIVGGLIFHATEGWSVGDAMYFCVVSLFTVGYGDLVPTSAGSKALLVLYVLVGVPLLAVALAKVTAVRMVNSSASFVIGSGRVAMVVSVAVPALLTAVVMSVVEGWAFGDACYFVVVTALTIGFGDIVPTTGAGKVFTCVYILVNSIWLFCLLGSIANQQAMSAVTDSENARASTVEMLGARRDSNSSAGTQYII